MPPRRRSSSSARSSSVTAALASCALAVGALVAAGGCSPSPDRAGGAEVGGAAERVGGAAQAPLPPVEFLVTAGDSTFWVRTGPWGASVRGAPLTLARFGGRFYEIYVGDDDRSFYDAVFVGQRVFRRDIVSGDSALVFVDSAVLRAARRYAAAHPEEEPLADDEDASDEPHTSFTSEVQLLDAFGPFVSYDFHARREVRGDVEDATARRGVLDLRRGRAATVADVVGAARADDVLRRGRGLFAAALDSVRHAHDERALAAQEALSGFVFDPGSFGVVDVDGAPGVAFVARGEGDAASGYTLPLPPVVVEPAPPWWREVRASLADADTLHGDADRWRRADAEVTARYDSETGSYTLALHAPAATTASASAGRGRRDWPLGRFQDPIRQLFWLDRPAVDSTVRHALARAFDESALYSDEARTASWSGGPRAGRPGGRWAAGGRRGSGVTVRSVARENGHAKPRRRHRL
jgi:hypothetical protein